MTPSSGSRMMSCSTGACVGSSGTHSSVLQHAEHHVCHGGEASLVSLTADERPYGVESSEHNDKHSIISGSNKHAVKFELPHAMAGTGTMGQLLCDLGIRTEQCRARCQR